MLDTAAIARVIANYANNGSHYHTHVSGYKPYTRDSYDSYKYIATPGQPTLTGRSEHSGAATHLYNGRPGYAMPAALSWGTS